MSLEINSAGTSSLLRSIMGPVFGQQERPDQNLRIPWSGTNGSHSIKEAQFSNDRAFNSGIQDPYASQSQNEFSFSGASQGGPLTDNYGNPAAADLGEIGENLPQFSDKLIFETVNRYSSDNGLVHEFSNSQGKSEVNRNNSDDVKFTIEQLSR